MAEAKKKLTLEPVVTGFAVVALYCLVVAVQAFMDGKDARGILAAVGVALAALLAPVVRKLVTPNPRVEEQVAVAERQHSHQGVI